MRGRKPKPIAQQIAEGDPRKIGKRKLVERLNAEPRAMRGFPKCPTHLAGLAKTTWKFLAEQIEAMNQDHRPDAIMLEGACLNYARAVEADRAISRDGITVEESIIDEKSGERIVLKIKAHPAVAISNAAWLRVRAFCSEFGLSPASRTRLTVEKGNDAGEEEDIRKLLSAPRARTFEPKVIQ